MTHILTHPQAEEIKVVGYERNGFDSRVEVDTLRSLYLVSNVCLGSG
jgi:hypothetical protein